MAKKKSKARAKPQRAHARVNVGKAKKGKGERVMTEGTCTNEERLVVDFVPETASGRPGSIDGAIEVTVQSGDGTVIQDPGLPLQRCLVREQNRRGKP